MIFFQFVKSLSSARQKLLLLPPPYDAAAALICIDAECAAPCDDGVDGDGRTRKVRVGRLRERVLDRKTHFKSPLSILRIWLSSTYPRAGYQTFPNSITSHPGLRFPLSAS